MKKKIIITLIVIALILSVPLIAVYDMNRTNTLLAENGFELDKEMQDLPMEKTYIKITDFNTDNKSYEVDETYDKLGIFEGRDIILHTEFFNNENNQDHFQIARYEEGDEVVYTTYFQSPEVEGLSRECPLLIDDLKVDENSNYYVSDCDQVQAYIDENHDDYEQAIDFLKDEYSFVFE